MKKIVLILLILTVMISGCSNYDMERDNIKPTNSDITSYNSHNLADLPKEELSMTELDALELTLNDEYKAEAIYQKVIDKFGDVKPFINIIGAEQKHSDTIIQLYEKYNLSVPINIWKDNVPEFESVSEACKAGVNAEIENAALYDKLLSQIDNQDIITVFTSLRDASINNHLPAFERCSGR